MVGIDEVGRGSWAGPVTVAAVVPGDEHLSGVRDSKLLTPAEREVAARARARLGARHRRRARDATTECDELGMTEALRRAASRALAQLAAQGFEPDRIVLDGKHDYLAMPRHGAHDREGRPDGAVGRGRVGGREGRRATR